MSGSLLIFCNMQSSYYALGVLSMKLCETLRSGGSSFWCQVIQGKYGRKHFDDNQVVTKNPNSFCWKAIIKIKPLPKMFISEVRVVRDGIAIKFFTR
jgi:hypothetical protein